MTSKNDDKLISGYTARKYLNCSKAEFESLVKQGLIQAYRDVIDRWRVSKKSVLDYMKHSLTSHETRFIVNENHYQEVITSVKDFFSMIWDEKWCINCHRAEKCNE